MKQITSSSWNTQGVIGLPERQKHTYFIYQWHDVWGQVQGREWPSHTLCNQPPSYAIRRTHVNSYVALYMGYSGFVHFLQEQLHHITIACEKGNVQDVILPVNTRSMHTVLLWCIFASHNSHTRLTKHEKMTAIAWHKRCAKLPVLILSTILHVLICLVLFVNNAVRSKSDIAQSLPTFLPTHSIYNHCILHLRWSNLQCGHATVSTHLTQYTTFGLHKLS